MAISVVKLVAGTEVPVGDGITQPMRCLVRFEDQSLRAAVLKTLTPEGAAAEAFCALLLRGWGLTVPEPVIVEGSPVAFASLDAGFPNLKQRLGWSAALPPQAQQVLIERGAGLVASFQQTPLALAADEAIDNRDRNFGNILWDGENVAWIDHEHALGVVAYPDRNKLADFAVKSGEHPKVQAAAVALSLTLGQQAVDEARAACNGLVETQAFAAQVAARLGSLAMKVLNRFPQPVDLFNPQSGQHAG